MRKVMAIVLRERETGLLALIVLLSLAAGMRDPAFVSVQNWRDILVNAAPILVLACGLMPVIVTGEIDISIGSLTGLLAGLLGVMSSTAQLGWSPAAATVFILAGGAAAGLATGSLVTLARIPSIIVTLGLLTALRGVMIWVMQGNQIGDFPTPIRWWGTGSLLGVPVPLCLALIVAAATGWMAEIGRAHV